MILCENILQMAQQQPTLTVCITGAAGQIAYSFIPQLCQGLCFPNRKINLRLLDITAALNTLKGVILQIQDSSYDLVQSIASGDNPHEMFKDADVIVFLGGFPRKPGMQRKDLLQMNKNIFMQQSKALIVAHPDVKCVVIANPANTNAYILSHYAPTVKKENITCLSRLDHNRAIGQIIQKTGCKKEDIKGVYIFGNHSLTQYPSISNITIKGQSIQKYADRQWLENHYIPKVQKRGGEILAVRGGSSVFSAGKAIVDHLRDWYVGSQSVISMGVVSNGCYGISKGLWSSFPVKCKNFQYQIIKDHYLSNYCMLKIHQTVSELQQQIQSAQII